MSATGVSMHPILSWVEASFATGRQVWFGTPGNLRWWIPAPTGKTFDPGLLEAGQTYQWRVDEVGPKGDRRDRTHLAVHDRARHW